MTAKFALAAGAAVLAMALAAVSPLRGASPGRLAWPLKSAVETQPFGCTSFQLEPYAPQCPSRHFHSGIDLAGPEGTRVQAAADGIARVRGDRLGYGLHVLLDHGGGLVTLYGHLLWTGLRDGDPVRAGAEVGLLGSSGLSTGPHLHFEVRRDGRPVDPRAYLPADQSIKETAMVNKVTLIGRLTADPEVKALPTGTHLANLRLATNTYGGKDEEGNVREHTEFHNLVLFGRPAEIAGSYLRKGRLLYAEGRLRHRTWEAADGAKRSASEVVVEDFRILDKAEAGAVT